MKFAIFFLFLIFALMNLNIYPDNIVYHNKTDRTVYVAPYYLHKQKAERIIDLTSGIPESIKKIPAKSYLLVKRPSEKKGEYPRYALFSLDEKEFKKELSRDQFALFRSIRIGTGTGPAFVVEFDKFGALSVYGTYNIVFHNKTDKNVYIATCYYHKLQALEISTPKKILPKSDLLLPLPEKKADGYTRYALFALAEKEFPKTLYRDRFKLFARIQIGTGKGPDFSIELDTFGKLAVYDDSSAAETGRKFTEAIATFVYNTKEATLGVFKKRYVDPKKYPHVNEIAKVRVSREISSKEKEIVNKRLRKISTKIKNVLHEDVDLNSVPRIAFCFSGGGFRAMLAALGCLMGAQKIGLLDYVCYTASLSGSTWGVGPWVTSEYYSSIDKYFEQMLPRIETGLFAQKDALIKDDIECLMKKVMFNQPISLIDLFGELLAHKLLSGFSSHKNPNNISLDEQLEQVSTGDIPFPIYTAILTLKMGNRYDWFEFTPCECGSDGLGGYVPSWAYGRLFKNGKSIGKEPPQSLGFILGTCGSAPAANLKEIWPFIKEKVKFKPLIKAMEKLDTVELGSYRMYPAKVWNPTVGMTDLPRSQQQPLALVDAGIDFNIPLPPLLRRKVDIIMIVDAAEYRKGAPEFKKAYERAKADGIKLPPVDFEAIKDTIFNIFVDEKDPKVPVIIYMPFVKNDRYSTTFDPDVEIEKGKIASFTFAYKEELARKVAGLVQFTLESHQNDIYETIRLVIDRKKRSSITIGGARADTRRRG